MSEHCRQLSDRELWRLGESDPAAFGELYERHADAVYNHCFRRMGSFSMAEDLTSAVFLDAWRRRREVVMSDESILPWLMGVANNAARNQHRALKRHRRLLAKIPPPTISPDPSDDVASRVDDERTMQTVLLVFRRLSPQEQDVLSLVIFAGLSYAEAAVAMGVPVGTVRSRLARAKARLQGSMRAHLEHTASHLPKTVQLTMAKLERPMQ